MQPELSLQKSVCYRAGIYRDKMLRFTYVAEPTSLIVINIGKKVLPWIVKQDFIEHGQSKSWVSGRGFVGQIKTQNYIERPAA